MASNTLPNQTDKVLTLCEDMEDGLNNYGGAIGIMQNTVAVMSAARSAATIAQDAFLTARGAKPPLTTAQTIADSNAKAFIATARGVLANYLGSNYSQTWEASGFQNGSLAMPATVEERQALLTLLSVYFTSIPAQEAPPLVTAARATTLTAALTNARNAVNGAQTLIGINKTARDAAVAALRKRMRGLIDELGTLLTDEDARWYAFGLNRPSDPETPGIPDSLVVTAGSPGVVYVDWADSRRADHYRVWKQIVGVDVDFISVATVTDSDATLTGLPTAATVNIQVTAVNNAGESMPSTAVSVVVA